MVDRKANPVWLVELAIVGAITATSTFFLSFVPVPKFPSNGHSVWAMLWAGRLQLAVWMLPLLIGVAITFWAQARFRRGFVDDVWSEEELAPVRTLLGQPFWRWAALLMYLAALLLMTFTSRGFHHATLSYLLVFAFQTVTGLKQTIAPAVVRQESWWRESRNFNPLQSEHWGEGGPVK